MKSNTMGPNTWTTGGHHARWYKRIPLPRIGLPKGNLPKIDFVRVFVCFGILSAVTLFGIGIHVANKIADAYITKSKAIDVRMDEIITPVKARMENVTDRVQNLEAHAKIIYYKIPKKKKYAIQEGGKTIGYTYR